MTRVRFIRTFDFESDLGKNGRHMSISCSLSLNDTIFEKLIAVHIVIKTKENNAPQEVCKTLFEFGNYVSQELNKPIVLLDPSTIPKMSHM